MKIDLDTPHVMAAVKEVLLDGIAVDGAIALDTEAGTVTRFQREAGKLVITDSNFVRETVHGKVEVTLRAGWSWNGEVFVYLKPEGE